MTTKPARSRYSTRRLATISAMISSALWMRLRPSKRNARSRWRAVVKITADCNNSISYTTQTAEIKVTSAGEIVYSPTGDPALDTTFIKCKM